MTEILRIAAEPVNSDRTREDTGSCDCRDGIPPGETCDCACQARLAAAGLRPTRQRRMIYGLLFQKGDRHVTAERLHGEAAAAGLKVSLATVYNALHQFERAGLVRQIPVDSTRTFFDTNTSDHLHFLDVDTGSLTDGPRPIIPDGLVAPDGLEIEGVDVVIRVRRARPPVSEERHPDDRVSRSSRPEEYPKPPPVRPSR